MDWTLCAICQKDTEEKLNCPISSKHSGHESVYKDVLDRARRFKELDAMPIAFEVDNADHAVWKEKGAAWHRSCTKLFSSYMLQRVEDSKKKSRKRKLTRSGTPVFEQMKCVFCQDELAKDLHKYEKLDDKVKRMAHTLEHDRLIGLLEKGDVVALDIQYHRDCLTTYERVYLRKIKPVSGEFSTDEVAKDELISKIEDDIASGITVFCMRELVDVYQTMLGDTDTIINPTRLKNEIIDRFHDLQEQQGARRSVYLIASKEMRIIISDAIQCDAEGHAKILGKVAMICRRAVSATERFNFDGSLSDSTEVVPPQLAHRVLLLLYAGGDHRTMSKPDKTISELLVFNMENLSRRRETPLPIYIGIWLHSQTRSKKLIKHVSELGMSVSFDRVISIEKRMAETVAHQARVGGIVCPHNLRNNIFTVGALDNWIIIRLHAHPRLPSMKLVFLCSSNGQTVSD